MRRIPLYPLEILATACLIAPPALAQTQQPPIIVTVQRSPAAETPSLQPLNDPATTGQIREYLKLSGEMDSFRARWIAAVDQNRALGAPYWPESFWTAIKTEMQATDLFPYYVAMFQHGISKDLMQEILDAYHRLGANHFQGSPECFKLGSALVAMNDEMDALRLAKTRDVITKVYYAHKPELNAARVKYLAEHPGWTDK
jgi:hypothetical protein